MMRWSFIVCTAGLLAGTADASQSFTNRAAFLAALGAPHTVYGFDSFAPGTVVDDQLPGVDFHGSGTVQASGSAHTAPNVLSTTASPFDFEFDVGTRGVGFHNTGTVDEIVTYAAVGPGGTLFQSLVPPGTFLGFISDIPIGVGSIGWIGPQNSTFSIDSFTFGTQAGAVPATTLPLAWALLVVLLAIALVTISRRTRTHS